MISRLQRGIPQETSRSLRQRTLQPCTWQHPERLGARVHRLSHQRLTVVIPVACALQVEDGTPFAKRYTAGDKPLPSAEDAAAMYRAASDVLTGAGFEHYEISNFAKPGHRCCIHSPDAAALLQEICDSAEPASAEWHLPVLRPKLYQLQGLQSCHRSLSAGLS